MRYDSRVFTGSPLGAISATVTSLPAGNVLGEEREEDGVWYRLCYNAGGASIPIGNVASPVPLNGGPYSLTVTTVTGANNHVGAVVAHHATVPTASYFWGARRGYLASGLVATGVCISTGGAILIAAAGSVYGLTVTVAGPLSGNVSIGTAINGPAAGTVAVRQGSVYLNLP